MMVAENETTTAVRQPMSLDDQVALLTRCVHGLQQSLIRAHEKLIELEADMGAAGIGPKAEKKSTLILPDRMN